MIIIWKKRAMTDDHFFQYSNKQRIGLVCKLTKNRLWIFRIGEVGVLSILQF